MSWLILNLGCVCQTIVVSFKNGALHQSPRQGIYQRAGKVNGKTSWISSSNNALWYNVGSDDWMIGPVDNLGSSIGGISSTGEQGISSCPYTVPNDAWKYSNNGWIIADTDDVKRQGEDQLDSSRDKIKYLDFKKAVTDCLSDDPVYGICSDSIFGPISDWNTSLVTSMDSAFNEKTQFNGNIAGWDTSSVRDMSNMFFKAKAFDQDIGNWKKKTSQVTTMDSMFYGADAFNRDI